MKNNCSHDYKYGAVLAPEFSITWYKDTDHTWYASGRIMSFCFSECFSEWIEYSIKCVTSAWSLGFSFDHTINSRILLPCFLDVLDTIWQEKCINHPSDLCSLKGSRRNCCQGSGCFRLRTEVDHQSFMSGWKPVSFEGTKVGRQTKSQFLNKV